MNTSDIVKILESTGVLKVPNGPGDLWNIIQGYMGEQAIDFDTEAIEFRSSYRVVFNNYTRAVRQDLRIDRKDCNAFFDFKNQKAGISITISGETYSSEWEQVSDWVSDQFFIFIQDVLEPHLPGRFVHYVPLDQCYRGIYVHKDIADTVDKAFREYEKSL